tara:strand:+ start:133 stop:585 length:453 start_codon:yes stop_codon:yes gene_type:complete
MAFTRFSSDASRQSKHLEESTFNGIYHLNTPGNGLNNKYIEDPHIRLQKWGANLNSNSCAIESDLRRLNHSLSRDQYEFKDVPHKQLSYSKDSFNVNETRASHPAWFYREKQQQQYGYLPLDPQRNIFIPFEHNSSTRILEKDYYLKNKK